MAHDEVMGGSQLTPTPQKVVSRRNLLFAGAAGVLGAGALSLNFSVITAAKPLSAVDRQVYSFLMDLFAARAQAVLSNNATALRPYYDPANMPLLQHEAERVTRLHHMASDVWGGNHKRISATVVQLSSQNLGNQIAVDVEEMVRYDWLYRPIPMPAYIEAARKNDLELAARTQINGVNRDGTTTSGGTVKHEMTLGQHGTSFVVLKDAYIELFQASPDAGGGFRSFPGGPIAAISRPEGRPIAASAQYVQNGVNEVPECLTAAPTTQQPLANGTTATAAVNYANSWTNSRNCATYADWDYPNGGGDCANFVSQCLYNGSILTDSTWNRGSEVTKHCPAGSSTYRTGYGGDSHYTWVNNGNLRNWLINSGNGVDASSNMPWNLAIGDTVNYDWTGDGTLDHITMVVVAQTGSQTAQIASHNANGIWSWRMNGAARYYGTHVYYRLLSC